MSSNSLIIDIEYDSMILSLTQTCSLSEAVEIASRYYEQKKSFNSNTRIINEEADFQQNISSK